jgi:hypothetical protein
MRVELLVSHPSVVAAAKIFACSLHAVVSRTVLYTDQISVEGEMIGWTFFHRPLNLLGR